MAIVDVNFYSQSLLREVTFKAIIPIERDGKPFKTIYLLHGIMGNYQDWIYRSRVLQLAMKHQVAVVMPSGDNSFYLDHENSLNFYGEYIGKELVETTRVLFPISTKREDTCIAGLSMGGYGALRNGLKYNDTFGAIAGLSSAIVNDIAIHSTNDAEWPFRRRHYLEYAFGDLTKLNGSDKDLEALVLKLKENNLPIPRIYFACGTEDDLLPNNRQYHEFLQREHIKHSYVESSGKHDWKFWDEYIEKVIEWF